MNLLFNQNFIIENKRKLLVYKIAFILLLITYLIVLSLFIFIHDSIEKTTFIICLTIITTIDFSLLLFVIKMISYYNRLVKLITNSSLHEFTTGILKELVTYSITINGLLFKQYELVSNNTQIVYVLNGIDISNIVNKKIKIGTINNVIYSYEVLHD